MIDYSIHLALIGAVIGSFAGKRIGWAIRAWPGHEEFHCDYLDCPDCEGGKKRGCYNAGRAQDRFYIVFSTIIAALSLYFWGLSTKAMVSWIFSVSCLIITIVDIRYLIIPDTLSINGCWTGLLYSAGCWAYIKAGYDQPAYFVEFSESLTGFVVGGGFLWLLGRIALILLKKEGMGGGDVKLLAAMGAWAGWKVVLGTIILASFLGAIFGIIGILYRRIRYGIEYKPLSHMIPFGPYLCISFIFIFYCGLDPLLQIMNAYNSWLTRSF